MEFKLRAKWYDIMDDVCFRIAFILLLYFFYTLEFSHYVKRLNIVKEGGKNIEKNIKKCFQSMIFLRSAVNGKLMLFFYAVVHNI